MQPDSPWMEIFKTVLPAVTLLATGVVGVLISALKSKLDANTALTLAAKTKLEATADDQATGLKDAGKWRYEINEKMAILGQKFSHIEQRMSDADVHRLLALVQTQAPIAPVAIQAPNVPPVVLTPSPQAATGGATVNVYEGKPPEGTT